MAQDAFTKWLKNQLRRTYRMMPNSPASEAWTKARVSYGKYICAHCNGIFGPTHMAKDHIDPVDPVDGWKDWNNHIERLFHGQIQILCKDCHQTKSNTENSDRRKNKRARKS